MLSDSLSLFLRDGRQALLMALHLEADFSTEDFSIRAQKKVEIKVIVSAESENSRSRDSALFVLRRILSTHASDALWFTQVLDHLILCPSILDCECGILLLREK